MTTKWGKWLQEDPHHDQHSHKTEWCTNPVCARLISPAIPQPMLLFGIRKWFFAHCSLVCAITLLSLANTVHPEAEVWIHSVILWLLLKRSRVQIRRDKKIKHAENKWGEMRRNDSKRSMKEETRNSFKQRSNYSVYLKKMMLQKILHKRLV